MREAAAAERRPPTTRRTSSLGMTPPLPGLEEAAFPAWSPSGPTIVTSATASGPRSESGPRSAGRRQQVPMSGGYARHLGPLGKHQRCAPLRVELKSCARIWRRFPPGRCRVIVGHPGVVAGSYCSDHCEAFEHLRRARWRDDERFAGPTPFGSIGATFDHQQWSSWRPFGALVRAGRLPRRHAFPPRMCRREADPISQCQIAVVGRKEHRNFRSGRLEEIPALQIVLEDGGRNPRLVDTGVPLSKLGARLGAPVLMRDPYGSSNVVPWHDVPHGALGRSRSEGNKNEPLVVALRRFLRL